jgi:bilirubin oxidase
LRFLNGSNSRFLILKMVDDPLATRPATPTRQFTQIGAEGGLLPASVELDQLLMGPAERADAIVDFRGLPAGTEIYIINEGPDEPFGGGIVGTDFPPADPNTTGQVMKFVVVEDTALGEEFNSIPTLPGITPLGPPDRTRRLSLNELDSQQVCVTEDAQGNVVQIPGATPPDCGPQGTVFGPVAALLGILDDAGNPVPKFWAEPITENPQLGDTEVWELHNFTADAHPIHPHLVQFQVVNREDRTTGVIRGPEPWETGFKDTVIALPGEITRIKATFDKPGLYVWHCHILEHEDNEMMRAYFVGDPVDVPPTP